MNPLTPVLEARLAALTVPLAMLLPDSSRLGVAARPSGDAEAPAAPMRGAQSSYPFNREYQYR